MIADVVLRTLKAVWQCLEPLELPMAILGGLSVSVWEHSRATRDVDILIDLGAMPPDQLIAHMQPAGFRLLRSPPLLQIGDTRILQVLHEPRGSYLDIRADLIFADSEYSRRALSRRGPAQLPGLDIGVQVLACEDIILHKLLAGRLLDRADTVFLLRANRPQIDFAFLREWIAKLNVQAGWEECWREAFPGEALP